MRRSATLLVLAAVTLLFTLGVRSAQAGPFPVRAPQIVFQDAALQGYLDGLGESIAVGADQVDASIWASAISGNTLFTLMIEVTADANLNSMGVYNSEDASPTPALFQLFPAAAAAGWYAVASFQSGGRLVVSLFDAASSYQGQTVYNGVNSLKFGFYIQGPAGTFYTQDGRNGGDAHALVYAGSGNNVGDWWMCFEDAPYATASSDFDDAVLLLQSVAPTPTHSTSWGALKTLYR
ncbi:MAG: hypothetical protein ACRENS_09150 [Candidatus Eiseniibacteriota bacterium]